MTSGRNISFGFIIVIALLAVVSMLSIQQIGNLGQKVDDIYRHPFTVSNAAKSIEIHLVSMHRNMKDVVLADDDEQLDRAVAAVDRHEQSALSEFDTIFERFLGDRAQINKAYHAFIAWKPIRDEVIQLTRDGNFKAAAAITKGRGADHLEKLSMEVRELVTFAFGKAESFHGEAIESQKQSLTLLYVLSGISIILAILIAFIVHRTIRQADLLAKQRAHTIDQNILLATLDTDGKVLEATNALCRFLDLFKEDLVGRPSRFFDNSDEAEETQSAIWRTVKTGRPWKGEIKRIGLDGVVHWASTSVIPNHTVEFELAGYTVLMEDTTNKHLSYTDKLTELQNRRRFEEVFDHELRLAKRNQSSLVLAIIDVDHFKLFNDEYGHPAGDVALSKVAHHLAGAMQRPSDYAFRIGGEEFALLFTNVDETTTREFLESIRQGIEDLKISHGPSKVSDHLTISIGAQVIVANRNIDRERAYLLADKALYVAKEERNTVVLTV